MDYIDYFEDGKQKQRLCTPEEQAEIDERRAAGIDKNIYNYPILQRLEEIDRKSIRALRESDSIRIAAYEAEALQLRLQLRK